MTGQDQDPDLSMGDYSESDAEDSPKYSIAPSTAPAWKVKAADTPSGGIPGVKYAQPMVLSYTPYAAKYGTTASQPTTVSQNYNAPTAEYKYADPPAEIRYTSKPVVPKKKKSAPTYHQEPAMFEQPYADDIPARPAYNVVTVEPGKPHKRASEPYPPVLPPGIPPPPRKYPMLPPGVPPPPPPASFGARGSLGSIPPYPEERGFRDSRGRIPSPPKNSHRLSTGMLPDMRGPSPSGMSRRLDRLSVSGDRPDVQTFAPGVMPPPSPMLEPYRGTWQSMPGMPSPRSRALDDFDDDDSYYDDRRDRDDRDDFDRLDQLSPRHSSASVNMGAGRGVTVREVEPSRPVKPVRRPSESSRRSGSPKRMDKQKKSVSMYNADNDAQEIARELTKATPNYAVLSDILPFLSHDQIMELHTAYKRVAKFQGRGINIAKHIRLKVSGHLRTIAYVTALGRWESEGYWANYWYQSSSSKRELLIESLMGRSNNEIHLIKENFKDKRYGDSLVRCMDKELPANKFRTAILLALEEKRQPEKDVWPREEVEKDADIWARSLRRREGGESAMLEICVMRSDRHLRECMRVFGQRQGGNFAKQALERSGNLVGEVMAHILNGVINRPARDAMLLHHALEDLRSLRERRESGGSGSGGEDRDGGSPRASASRLNPFSAESRAEREREREEKREKEREKERLKEDRKDRYELLISRLVRLHWEPNHLRKVKEEYKEKYGSRVEHDVEDYLKPGEFQEFCLNILD